VGAKYESGTAVFEPVMDELLPLKDQIGEAALQRIASKLIGGLLGFGWGNAEATVGVYDAEPTIVAAFKEHGVLLFCDAQHPDDGESCEEPERGHTAPHKDYLGRTWVNTEEEK